MNAEQQAFLENVSFSIALNGTVQPGKVYRAGSTELRNESSEPLSTNTWRVLLDNISAASRRSSILRTSII
jgi:hypothetical protein